MTENPALQQTLELIQQRSSAFQPDIAIILGSGLGSLTNGLSHRTLIPYAELPFFLNLTIAGHQAKLHLGELFGLKVAIFCGRFHVYQGLSAYETTLPVRLAAALKCRSVLLTCAVGGIADGITPGDFLLVKDHLNFSAINPLQGLSPPAFIDLHNCYQHDFFSDLLVDAECMKCNLHTGTLAYMPGPSYETPAEIHALRLMGAAAVSMSTVPEAIMAQATGLRVTALALVTNLAGGSPAKKLSHQDVLACSSAAAESFRCLVETLLPKI